MARPALEFCEPIGDIILERISMGEDLESICKDRDLPSVTTVYKWLQNHVEFANAYLRAREVMGDVLAARADYYAQRTHIQLPNGMLVPADPQRDKLIVDTLKWRAAHLRPKGWGDKTHIEHSGQINLANASEEDLIEELLALIASGRVTLPDGVRIVELPDDAEAEDDFSDLL